MSDLLPQIKYPSWFVVPQSKVEAVDRMSALKIQRNEVVAQLQSPHFAENMTAKRYQEWHKSADGKRRWIESEVEMLKRWLARFDQEAGVAKELRKQAQFNKDQRNLQDLIDNGGVPELMRAMLIKWKRTMKQHGIEYDDEMIHLFDVAQAFIDSEDV